MFYCHLSAFSRQTVYNEIIISWQYTLIIQLTIAIVHSIVSRIMLLFQFDYLIKSPLVSMLCSCHAFGTTVPSQWHNCAKHFAQPFQRLGTIVSIGGTTVLIACHKPYGYLNGKWRKERWLVTVWNEGSSPVHTKEEILPPCSRLNDRARWQ